MQSTYFRRQELKIYIPMKRVLLTTGFTLFLCGILWAQSEKFKPKSEPILRIFGNFHSGLTPDDTRALFEIERAYLGYSTQVSPNLSAEVKVDIGSPENESVYAMVKRYAYIRNAFITYKKGNFKTDVGIIGMTHFSVQEKFWGYRYVQKSFADRFKYGKSVDMGVNAFYAINKTLSFDAGIVNGEGYSQLQNDNYFEYTAGATVQWPNPVTWRLYTNVGPSATNTKMVYAAFAGITFTPKWNLGMEYNLLQNYNYRDGYNQFGYSVFSTYKLPRNMKVFGRFDMSQSNILEGAENPWNLAKDGSSLIVGAECKVNDHLKLSLNYQDWVPRAANLDDNAYVFLNLEFNL